MFIKKLKKIIYNKYNKIIIFAIYIAFYFAIYAAAFPANVLAYSGISVKVAYVKKTFVAKTISSYGIIRSNGRLIYSAPFTGRIIHSFNFPALVSPGTVIARIVHPGLYAKINAAEASLNYAKIKFKREKLLFRDGVAAKKDVESAKLLVENEKSILNSLKSYEQEGVLIANFKGTVHYLEADGSLVVSGSPVAVLNGKGKTWLKTYVTPSQSIKIYDNINMPATIKRKSLKEPGKIISIGVNAKHNGLVPIYVSLPKTSPLLPGEWVDVNFALTKTFAFSVPEKSLIILKGKTFIYTVKHGKAEAIKVSVITVKNKTAYIKINKNIKAGEPVITYPVARLISGVSVAVKP